LKERDKTAVQKNANGIKRYKKNEKREKH